MSYPSLNFALGETIDMLRDQVQSFVAKEIAPRAAQIDSDNLFPADLWRKFGDMGLLGITVAEEYGGAGLGYLAHVVSFSPLARGVLTGKYDPAAPPAEGTRAGRNDKRLQQTEWRPESLHLAQEIKQHAEARGISAGQFALAWVLNNQLITSAITGPRTEEQWDDYLPALNYQFTAEDEALVDRLVVTGHPSTPGFNDPSHVVVGRKPRNGG